MKDLYIKHAKVLDKKILFLVGSKVDQISDKKKRLVPIKFAEEMGKLLNANHIEISSKTNENVERLFELVIDDFNLQVASKTYTETKKAIPKSKKKLFGSLMDDDDADEDIGVFRNSFKKEK